MERRFLELKATNLFIHKPKATSAYYARDSLAADRPASLSISRGLTLCPGQTKRYGRKTGIHGLTATCSALHNSVEQKMAVLTPRH